MNKLDAVGWINAKLDILPKIKEAIMHPENCGPDRLKWLQTIVKHPLKENSKNLAKEIIITDTRQW